MIIPTEFSEKELNFLDSLTEEPFEFERISEMDSITCYVPFTRGKLQEMIEELAENISYPFNLLFDVAFTYSEKRRNVQSKSRRRNKTFIDGFSGRVDKRNLHKNVLQLSCRVERRKKYRK